jgi:hypothetical protein
MFTQNITSENDNIDLENCSFDSRLVPYYNETKETMIVQYLDSKKNSDNKDSRKNTETNLEINKDFLNDLLALRKKIKIYKKPLEEAIFDISMHKQAKAGGVYLGLSTLIAFLISIGSQMENGHLREVAVWNNALLSACIIGIQGVVAPSFLTIASGILGHTLPFYKMNFIKYRPLKDSFRQIDPDKIISLTKIANLHFPSIPAANVDSDIAEILRNINSTLKKINQEINANYHKRGKKILNALNQFGIFPNNIGPAQTILEYVIPNKSIIERLAPPALKRK